jgi:hypothetical protein
MEENKIQTAEEFIKDRYDWSSEDLERWVDNMSSLPMAMYDNVIDLMLEFAKLHVKAALKAAAENSDAYNKPKFERDVNPAVDLESILNAYPESNIK